MDKDLEASYKALKKDYLDLERIHRDERESLIRVINAFGAVVTGHGELEEDCLAVKKLTGMDGDLSVELIDDALTKFKEKIVVLEAGSQADEGTLGQITALQDRLLETCRTIKRMMLPILENFYPLTDDMETRARAVDIDCRVSLESDQLKETSEAFLAFVGDLKGKILEDFKYINSAFLTLLDQVKELEESLAEEFGGDERLKQIEYFEMKVNNEVGLIADSFNIHSTIEEIKYTVIEKIEKIKKLVALRKKDEMERAEKANENVNKLKMRITQAERDAVEMSKRAMQFQTAAMKDGLTDLYNRKAFDIKLKGVLEGLERRGQPFSMIMFDLDEFKVINDNFGHVAGDKVLKKVAQCLKETFRKNDFIARYGGDEFAVIVENLTNTLASERIASFNRNLKKRRFMSHKKGNIEITVSTGLATGKEGDTTESIIDRADKVMYAAKEKKKKKKIPE